jgi:deoxyribonuclease-4
MKIGAHVSAAGGLFNAPKNAAALNLECFQFFSRSPQGGTVKPLTQEDITAFKTTCEENKFSEYYIHAPYIINLASQLDRTRKGSIEILRKELERGTALGVRAMMFHPGSSKGMDREVALEVVAKGINEILKGYKGTTQLLIEISAGAGEVIGDTFEEVAQILKLVNNDEVGVCFDTAHAFASGYDLRTKEAVEHTMDAFHKTIGKNRLLISHCNDSKVDIGEHKDRHEHIGDGHIGKAGFKAMIESPSFKNVNLILETEPEEIAKDIKTLYALRDS